MTTGGHPPAADSLFSSPHAKDLNQAARAVAAAAYLSASNAAAASGAAAAGAGGAAAAALYPHLSGLSSDSASKLADIPTSLAGKAKN